MLFKLTFAETIYLRVYCSIDVCVCAGNDVNADWMLRHGRSAALFVVLKESPTTVYNPKEKDRVCTVILSYLAADRVQIVMNGVRACGYLFQYLMNESQSIPQQILSPFVRVSI